jgi:hypothetical protein
MLASTILILLVLVCVLETISAGTLRGQKQQQQQRFGRDENKRRQRRSLADLIFHAYPSSTDLPVHHAGIPSICLESPDDPVCDKLHQVYYLPEYYTQSEETPRRDPRPAAAPAGVPTIQYMATPSPTRDLCYGNMALFQHGKFCHSEMPSVSMEPSEQPTQFQGFPEGDSSSSLSDAPSDAPSTAPTTPPTQIPSESPSRAPTVPPTTRIPSEQPSAAPSHRPSHGPSNPPSESPSSSPSTTVRPSESPSANPTAVLDTTMDDDDDDDDDIVHYDDPDSEDVTDTNAPTFPPSTSLAPTNAPTTHAPTIPEGEQFSYDESGDGRAEESSYTGPYRPNASSSFRLKLYWQDSYYWQEETFERNWCMRCLDNQHCQVGEPLFLGDCGNWHRSAYFDFVYFGNNVVQIELILEKEEEEKENDQNKLCLERTSSRQVTLQECHVGNTKQHWKASLGSFTGNRFEISQTLFGGVEYCLTNHHHPKYGERLELYTCEETRRDTTNFWNVSY